MRATNTSKTGSKQRSKADERSARRSADQSPSQPKPERQTHKRSDRRTQHKIIQHDQPRPITIGDLRRIVSVGSATVSPDGTTVAFVHKLACRKNDYRSTIYTVPADASAPPKQFTNGLKDTQPAFSPDGTTIYFAAKRDGRQQIHAIPTNGGEATQLTHLPEGTIRDFHVSPAGDRIALAFRSTDPERTIDAAEQRKHNHASDPPKIIDSLWHKLDGDGYFGDRRFRLYLIDTSTGEHSVLDNTDTLGTFAFCFSPDGKHIAITTNRHKRAALEPKHTELRIIDRSTGNARTVEGQPAGPKTHPRWSPDGKSIAYAGREGDDPIYSSHNLELFITTPAGGPARSLTRAHDHCLLALSLVDIAEAEFNPWLEFSPDSKHVFYRLGLEGQTHLASLSRRGGQPTIHTLRKRQPPAEQTPCAISPNNKHAIISRCTPTDPPHLITWPIELSSSTNSSKRAAKPKALTHFNEHFTEARITAQPEDLAVTSDDGTPVHTRIILPPAEHDTTTKLPAVLMVHGGPHAQYGAGFIHEFQCLAGAGFVVVFANPRGSKGYGEDFCNAIRGDWGNKDWQDIQAVIHAMQHHPRIDPARMAIAGGSYGGYIVNCAIARSNAFAAAVSDRCVTDLPSHLGTTDHVQQAGRYFPGRFFDDTEQLKRMSPLAEFASAKTPTLLIHSEGDLRCSIGQSEQAFTALQLLGVPSRLVRYPASTSHGMSRNGPPDLREHRLNQILDWLTRYTRPRRKAAR